MYRRARRGLGRWIVRIPVALVRLWLARMSASLAGRVHGRGPKAIPLDARTSPVLNAMYWRAESPYPATIQRIQINKSSTILLDDFTFEPNPPGHVFGDRFVFRIESATVHVPTGLVFADDGRVLTPSGAPLRDVRSTSRSTAAAEEVRLATLCARRTTMKRKVFPIGAGPAKNYFHWNVDFLPRILHAARAFPDLIVVAPELPRFAQESMELAGVEYLISDAILLPSEIILVDFSDAGWMHPTDAELLRGFAERCVTDESSRGINDKIFLSRSDTWGKKFGTRNRSLVDERILEETLFEHGFRVVVPAELSFREQVMALAGAKTVAGVHGAGMSNILWCQDRIHVVEVVSEALFDSGPRRLAGARGDLYTRVLAHPRQENHFGSARDVLGEVLQALSSSGPDSP